MDTSLEQTTFPIEEDNEWDTDGFVIPSLELGDKLSKLGDSEVETSKPPSPKVKAQENIYLGPHGAPPSQTKQHMLECKQSSRKQRFKQKLKEADLRITGSGRENKMDNLRELVGGAGVGKTTSMNMPKGSSRDWLDPYCHESQFEKWHH